MEPHLSMRDNTYLIMVFAANLRKQTIRSDCDTKGIAAYLLITPNHLSRLRREIAKGSKISSANP